MSSLGDPADNSVNPMGNILIGLGATASLGYVIFKIRQPFKTHSFNTFAYIILLLICYSLFGKRTFCGGVSDQLIII